MMQRVLWALAASLWGGLVFMLGLHLFFPGEALRERVEWQVAESSDEAYQLSIVGADFWRLSGVSLDTVTLYKAAKQRGKRKADADAQEIEVRPVIGFERLAARLQLLPLLSGKQSVSFSSDLYGGTADGVFSRRDDGQGLELDARDIRLDLLPLAGENWSLSLAGLGKLVTSLDIATEELADSSGNGELKLTDLEMVAGSVFGFDLPENEAFDKALIRFKIDKGKVEISEGVISGELLELKIDGAITLSSRGFFRSRPRLDVEIRPSESLDSLLKLAPGVKEARQSNGTYKYVVTGTMQNPRFRADQERKTRTTRSRRVGNNNDDDDDAASSSGSDETAEERREARRERLRERREKMRERREERQDDASQQDDFDDEDEEEVIDDEEFEDRIRLEPEMIGGEDDEDFDDEPPMDVDYDYDD